MENTKQTDKMASAPVRQLMFSMGVPIITRYQHKKTPILRCIKNVEVTAPIDSTINMYADLSKSDLVRSENTQSDSVNDNYHASLYLCVFIAYTIG